MSELCVDANIGKDLKIMIDDLRARVSHGAVPD